MLSLSKKTRGAAMNHANKQQIVLITGAAGRLGKAFSKSIVASGGNVFLIDVDEEQGQHLVSSCISGFSSFHE